MQYCTDPIPLHYLRGQPPLNSPIYGRRMRDKVSCGKCKACRANRKMDWSGRLYAEALFSSEVVFSTFTYKEEPERFRYSDIQTMLRKMRDDARYFQKNNIRFFCVGEKGTLHNRKHWHMLMFFSQPSGLIRWGRETHPGQLWEHWPHGWADIQPLAGGEWLHKIRYTAKYCLKDNSTDERYPCKSSLKPGIGDAFFRDLADRMAKAGVAPNGKYQHDGIRWERGRKKGELVDFSMTHATRYNFIDYYRAAWEKYHPEKDVPMTEWMQAFDDEAIAPYMRVA